MKLEIIKSEGLAHNSYYLSNEGEALVVDPRRDCKVYTTLAKRDCAKIKYILETHRNEDYVIGSLELQNLTEAEICHSNALPFKYGEHNLTDNDALTVGTIKVLALYTPGHTKESLCYVVYPSSNSNPKLVLTGDTLFAGSVGRTDLYGKQAQQKQSENLYNSLHEKLLSLGEGVLVYPGHGQGSVCGHGISGDEPTTIGYEKKTNPYLQLGRDEFVQKTLGQDLLVPRYFKRIEELNLNGAPLLSELAYPKPLDLSSFEEEMQESRMIVIDTRMPYSYAAAHIPKALSIWLGGTSVYPGWLLDSNQYIICVNERPSDIDTVTPRLRRLGFDNVCGYLCGGMNQWQEAGKPFSHTHTMTITELEGKVKRGDVLLLDVRQPHEWMEEGVIEGARLINFSELPQKAASLPQDKPIVATCSVGNRASIAISILERAGFSDVSNALGGMDAWTRLGYPTKKP